MGHLEMMQTFQSRIYTFLDGHPEHLFAGASLEQAGQMNRAGADIPEEDTEGVDVNTVVVLAREQFWCHVNRSAHHAPRHHRLWLAEAKVRQLSTIVIIEL